MRAVGWGVNRPLGFYVLAFKILSVSLHALQLTHVISVSQIANLPIIDLIGFFPTWEILLRSLRCWWLWCWP